MRKELFSEERMREITAGFAVLNQKNLMKDLEVASDGHCEGGDALMGPALRVAIRLNLVYKCSGKLKSDVYRLLRGDTPHIVSRVN